jgi:hypothetical protein
MEDRGKGGKVRRGSHAEYAEDAKLGRILATDGGGWSGFGERGNWSHAEYAEDAKL